MFRQLVTKCSMQPSALPFRGAPACRMSPWRLLFQCYGVWCWCPSPWASSTCPFLSSGLSCLCLPPTNHLSLSPPIYANQHQPGDPTPGLSKWRCHLLAGCPYASPFCCCYQCVRDVWGQQLLWAADESSECQWSFLCLLPREVDSWISICVTSISFYSSGHCGLQPASQSEDPRASSKSWPH